MNVLIYNEGVHDKEENIKKVYPNGIHGAIREAIEKPGINIKIATLDNVSEVITKAELDNTDVLIWWGHICHDDVPDVTADLVCERILGGMGFIALHSAHYSKPFKRLMGTTCSLRWRDNDRERIWCIEPTHPIAVGLPDYFELPNEEMYGEHFDVPAPDETVFMGWFAGGELFRSGICYKRGYGKIFYFQPGHEEYPAYYDTNVVKILQNAVEYVKPLTKKRENFGCIHPKEPIEK